MLINSSSTSMYHLAYLCSKSKLGFSIFTGMMSVKTVLLLPLCIFILYLGYQQWRRQRSFQVMSHSDLFTYHLAVMELFWGPGIICYLCGTYIESKVFLISGNFSLSLTYFGEGFFHLLTCVERYLAVVHPVIYRGSRNARGVRIRNVSIGSAWMMGFGFSSFTADSTSSHLVIVMLSILVTLILIVTFCSITVLCVLVRPVPGDNGEEKKQLNQSKLRAFHTITAISCVLWVWFGAMFASVVLISSHLLSESVACLLNASVCWFNLPYSLVLPLLYLNRKGKLWMKGNDCD